MKEFIKDQDVETLAVHSLLIRAMKDANLVACDCYVPYDKSEAKFSWNGKNGATLDETFSAANTYSIRQLLTKLKATPELMAAFKFAFGTGETVTFTKIADELVAQSRKAANVDSSVSNLGALKKAGVLA